MFNDTAMSRVFYLLAVMIVCAGTSSWAGEGSVIKGKVTVLDLKGAPKKDHSGVVVFLDELENAPALPNTAKKGVIRQSNKQFVPQVLAVETGTTVDFPNDDLVFHNVFSLSKTKPFDLGLYKQGDSRSVAFEEPGLVKVYCNIHPQMIAYVLVLPHSYYAVTDVNGSFEIPSPPQQTATIRTWFPRAKDYPEQQIKISGEGIQNLSFEVIEDLRFNIKESAISIEHKNKYGQSYPSKY